MAHNQTARYCPTTYNGSVVTHHAWHCQHVAVMCAAARDSNMMCKNTVAIRFDIGNKVSDNSLCLAGSLYQGFYKAVV